MERVPTNGPRPSQRPSPEPEKSCQLFIRDHPSRAIAIVSSTHHLIFRYSNVESENSSQVSLAGGRSRNAPHGPQPRCMVEFSRNTNHALASYRPLTSQPIFGTLGLTAVDGDVFLCVVTHASRAATIRPGETVERISCVEFYCLNTAEYDDVFSLDNFEEISDAHAQGLARREMTIEQHPCQDLRKVLSNGTFYYSTDFDLTNRLQDRPTSNTSFEIENFDEGFLWNSYMINPLIKFRSRLMPPEREALDNSRILTSAIRGFCGTMTIPQTAAPVAPKSSRLPSFLSVISRLSCKRAGTRFNSRGIDDDGNVANFVETETTYWSPAGIVFSYVQVRGSVPVFWEQAPDLIPGRQKISVTRSPDGTQPAFNRHFKDLEESYGAIHILNLLSDAKPGEAELTHLYRYGAAHCPLNAPEGNQSADHALLRSTEYDFHAETRAMGYEAAKGIRRYIEESIDAFAYFLAQEADDGTDEKVHETNARLVVVLQQEGAFRTNCLDCLDRTNLIQTMVSQMAVEAFLGHRGEYAASDFWMRHSSLWADNGDALSKIYAGTGALKSSFTRHGKMSLSGAMADFRKSAQRLYHNNFTDPSRQMTIDFLLGRIVGQQPVQLFDPISDYVAHEVSKRSSEYSSNETISIYVGTFNLNGRTEGTKDDLSCWLWPESLGSTLPDIVVIGFQEIVELSPQQIMNSDPSRKQLWEQAVKKTLNSRAQQAGGEKYVVLRSGQLVGAALCIFVRSSILGNIKNVEGSVKKTGMQGMAGNKGAVAIRLDYANTPICFVTAHLAAGFSNYDERNKDFSTIDHGLRFQRNRSIDDHDTVIWLGDFNYRIDLDRETAIAASQQGDLAMLYDYDQLNKQMVAGACFPYYGENRITFAPTYRYDIGTDEFDSSEKARIPAWTDRILRKGSNIKQLAYGSAPLRFSDHRPVYAVFNCTVSIVDEALRQSISEDLYKRRKAELGDSGVSILDEDSSEDEDLIGYDAIEPGLPPASSDRQKWWLANGQPARVDMTPPVTGNGMTSVLNPNRPPNPFTPTDEPDWVSVPRSSSRQSQSSMASSAYEVINNPGALSSSAGTPSARRLPPPYDSGSLPGKVNRPNLMDEPVKAPSAREAPPPPLPRRQGSTPASQVAPEVIKPVYTRTAPPPPPSRAMTAGQKLPAPTSQESKPSAPPVAKKPSYLASTSPTPSAASLAVGDRTGDEAARTGASKPPLPIRSSTAASNISMGSPQSVSGGVPRKPAIPPKPAAVAATGAGAPPVKKTPPVVPAKKAGGAVDLLDSLEEDGAGDVGGWETLKPTG